MLESTVVLIVKAIVIFVIFLQIVPIVLLAERKILGRFQSRIGPNRVGPYGLLQPLPTCSSCFPRRRSRRRRRCRG